MPVLAIVGPPNVGKSELADLFVDVLGNRVNVEEAPPMSVPEEEAYRWGFSALSSIAIEHDDELHIFDGFPHPDYWAFWNTKFPFQFSLLQANLEKRMATLDAKYLWLVPDSWNGYEFENPAGKIMRTHYNHWIRNTGIGTMKRRTSDISVDLVNEVCEELGFSYA